MPNGNHDFDLASVEAWFAPLSEVVLEFARRRNLYLDKYYHNTATWALRFAHPSGGIGSIEILKMGARDLRVSAHWHIDDEGQCRRSLHWRPTIDIPNQASKLAVVLEEELAALAATPTGRWSATTDLTPPRGGWQVLLRPQYPSPKL